MRIAFLGTPEFALPSLQMLLDEGHTLQVYTQPDKPVGRKAVLTPPPVKVFAQNAGIPVYQFKKIRSPEGVEALKTFSPDLMVTAAFGQLLSGENLAIPRYGCINVHGSLLPRYRGAAPIQWAIINGECVTGVTTMMTDIGLDTGDILLKKEMGIDKNETASELATRMAVVGASLLKDTIALLCADTLPRTKQDEKLATKCAMLKKEDGKLNFKQDAQSVHNRVRGTNPWPGAYALLKDEPIKIWRTACVDIETDEEPGKCFSNTTKGLFIACKEGAVEVLELQAPGGKRMDAQTFLRGKTIIGEVLQ